MGEEKKFHAGFGSRTLFGLLAGLALLWFVAPPAVAVGRRVSVKVDIANVRQSPSRRAKVLWQVSKYHPFVVVTQKGDWYKCRDFEGDSGWVAKSVLGRAATVITIKDDCNVRSGPGTKYPVRYILDREIPLKVLTRKGRWLKIEHEDGEQGWIHASLVW